MSEIKLLPDAIANQIAAGEVVQRPASVVKELLENAIDAGSKQIDLIIEDSGKKLIKVVDNGKGLSEFDIRLAFERHATSKIKGIEDLFKLNSYGFRGEALASIAAVSQVEMQSKQESNDFGNSILIESSEVKNQEPCQCGQGTSISVKNLFYNTPARKNFLKSNRAEFQNIYDEFVRVALSYPAVALNFYNGREIIHKLKPANLKSRIVSLLGKKYESALVPLEEETPLLKISGFIVKPELARKKRGEQYFFVNSRYIRSPYFHHAIKNAYEHILPTDYQPSYFIYFNLDPAKVDVNVHPTKTEVKFEDEKAIYAILKASVKKALSQHNIAPGLSFDREDAGAFNKKEPDSVNFNTGFMSGSGMPEKKVSSKGEWKEFYKILSDESISPEEEESVENQELEDIKTPIQVQKKYIVSSIRSGLLLVHQHFAHQRILYEKFLKINKSQEAPSQNKLFPEMIELNKKQSKILNEMKDHFHKLGFGLEDFGNDTIIINAIPSFIEENVGKEMFMSVLSDLETESGNSEKPIEILARILSRNSAIPSGRRLRAEEMNSLIDQLFACEMPYYSPSGHPVMITISMDELDKKFEKPK